MAKFDYSRDFKTLDFRAHPELYQVGRGEQGVLSVEPYKSEILSHWRFRDPETARASAEKIFALYLGYKEAGDFVGMDMARKFLQMGYTRSMRYYRHKTGQKYVGPVPDDRKGQSGAHGRAEAPLDHAPDKLECARLFKEKWDAVKADAEYLALRQKHVDAHEKPNQRLSPRRGEGN